MNIVSENKMVIDRTLGYPVKDIMTPENELTCWSGSERDRLEINQNARQNGFSFIPVKSNGRIDGIVRATDIEQRTIPDRLTLDWLVTADTPILQVIELLAHHPERPFLVLQASEIVGLVASADLNKIKARASLYLLVAHFESQLVELIREHVGVDENAFSRYLDPTPLRQRVSAQQRASGQNINLSLIHYLYLRDLEIIVSRHPVIRNIFGFVDEQDACNQLSFSQLRNPVSHQTNRIVASIRDVNRLNENVGRLLRLSERLNNS